MTTQVAFRPNRVFPFQFDPAGAGLFLAEACTPGTRRRFGSDSIDGMKPGIRYTGG